jgi:elongation factor P
VLIARLSHKKKGTLLRHPATLCDEKLDRGAWGHYPAKEHRNKIMVTPNELRKGNVILYQGQPHLVLDVQHRTQGRQAGFVQAGMRNLETGSSTNTKLRSTDRVDLLDTEVHNLEFSYVDGNEFHFMNPESFEDVVLDRRLLDDVLKYLVESHTYDVLYVEGKPVQIQLPSVVEIEVTEASDAIRGDTASAATKPVTTKTGLVVQVPLFVKKGDVIRVNTESGAYGGRA